MNFFLTLKKVANVLTDDIFVDPFGSTEQNNGKNFVDSNGNAKTDESTASDLQLTKEVALKLMNLLRAIYSSRKKSP